jgi:CheY-like chemotaxis protein
MSPPPKPVTRRILVIEDNDDSRATLCALLELGGHQVEGAADGAEGVRKALAWAPDTAVIDIGLPRLDGYQVARQLRDALKARITLIALTAYSTAEDRRRAHEAGFDLHLSKPADPDQFLRLLAG